MAAILDCRHCFLWAANSALVKTFRQTYANAHPLTINQSGNQDAPRGDVSECDKCGILTKNRFLQFDRQREFTTFMVLLLLPFAKNGKSLVVKFI